MSVTNEIQIQKSRQLIDGLRKNINEIRAKGINESELKSMSEQLDALSAANKECDAIRATLKTKSRAMNNILAQVKESFATKKKVIKSNYPQEKWINFGVI